MCASASQSAQLEIIVSDKPQKIYEPRSLRSQLLNDRLPQQAYDFDHCGKTAKTYGCTRHGDKPEPVKRIPQTCKQRFTKCCEPRVHHQRMEKHDNVIDMMMTLRPGDWDDQLPTQISAISVRKPMRLPNGEYDMEKALIVGQKMKEALRRLIAVHEIAGEKDGTESDDTLPTQYFIKIYLQGFIGDDAIYKGVYWGPHEAPARIRWALLAQVKPDAVIEVTTEPNRSAERLFSEMFHTIVPDDEAEQAKLEIVYHGKDLVFYSQRIDDEILNDYGSFPSIDSEGNEEHEHHQNCDRCHSELIPTCQKCGKQADVISEIHPMDATPEEIANGKWEKIFPDIH